MKLQDFFKNMNKRQQPDSSTPARRKARKSFPANGSQNSTFGGSSSTASFIDTDDDSNGVESDLVSSFVSFFLVKDQTKKPIRKQDILRNVFVNQDNKLFPLVFQKANAYLQKIFGFRIQEIESEKRKCEYILVNVLPLGVPNSPSVRDYMTFSDKDFKTQGLILFILTIIYMNGNSISEDQFWKALEPLGIDIKTKHNHPVFGDIRKLVTVELVNQLYLEYTCLSKEPPRYEISWGERAKREVRKADLLNLVCQIKGDDTEPSDWASQYEDAKADAQNDEMEQEDEE